MRRILAAAYVIARRDYLATVMSRTFIMFILSPLTILAFSGGIGFLTARNAVPQVPSKLAVVAPAPQAQAFARSYAALGQTLDHQGFEEVLSYTPSGPAVAQARAILSGKQERVNAVLIGLPDAPQLIGPQASIEQLRGGILVAAQQVREGSTPRPLTITETYSDPAGSTASSERNHLGGYAKTLLFFLNMLLAGMMLSNLVEEKSNKIIEILIAAVPVDAVFFGKLMGMLAVSATIVLAYGLLIGGAYLAVIPPALALTTPAIGWPLFIALGFGYFVMNYMLVGGIFLGLGAQANTPREVQTISMPTTFAQMLIFMLASGALGEGHSHMWWGAAVFPLSSPLVMVAEGAKEAQLWPHLLAFAWLTLWVVLIIRFAARRFSRHVLKSGPEKARR